MKKQKKGFTLVELLVVIAIIGLLSTLAVVALGSARAKARDARRMSDVRQVQTGLELYYSDKGGYPPAAVAVTLGDASNAVLCDTAAGFQADGTGCGTTYLGQVPANFAAPVQTPAGYMYTSTTTDTYSINFVLEGQVQSLAAGAHTASQSGIQ